MRNDFVAKMLFVVMLCAALLYSGCYSPLIHLQSVGLAKDDTMQKKDSIRIKDSIYADKKAQPLIFYKECSRNGSAWLYECQSIGLESMQQAIYLYYPNALLNNITMKFYPQKTYIRFEIDDSSVMQDIR
ncbi:hypothetical protein [Helicobacter bilis]|uniref:Uncharacterized protein n=2 Tax=Helicobacter bilis TaxID=37372 RepID=A0A6D2C9W4_9HELI|nr:hypothetical protein [Helicobacter bilis]EMZ39262.1 hypothetical protein C826_01238 [Helicobacter bilis WiWa]TLE05186.1 hypothetical protein LS77_003920 [Helicobacter bilis]TLE06339.1 hypothetical protein LS76_003215 [Helicobacter bilis]